MTEEQTKFVKETAALIKSQSPEVQAEIIQRLRKYVKDLEQKIPKR